MHRKPNVFVIDDFLTEPELEHLGRIIHGSLKAGGFRASFTQDGDRECVSEARTSTFMWLGSFSDSFLFSLSIL